MKDYFEYAADLLAKKRVTEDSESVGQTIYAPSLAMAYIPRQKFRNLFTDEEGFEKGTIFKELYKPFEGWKCDDE